MYARLACLVLCSLAVALPEGVYAQDFYYGVTNAIRKNTQNLITSGVKFPEGIAIDESARKIYWVEADPDNPAIRRANLDGTGVQTVISTEITTPRGLALDVPRGKMYWVDVGEDKLFRANLNGSGRETLFWLRYVPGGTPRFPTGVTLDLSGGRVYWTDANTGRIYRSPLDGCSLTHNKYPCVETVVTGVQQALLGLAVDPGGGKIYWAEDGSNQIKRANLNGTGIETVVSGLDKPYGLALDLTDRKLYWCDANRDQVRRANLDGSDPETVASGVDFPSGIALIVPPPPRHDLELTGSVTSNTGVMGDGASFIYTLHNRGPDDATTIRTHIPLPSSLTYVASLGGSYDPATGIATIDALASGASINFGVAVTLDGPGFVAAEIVGSGGIDTDALPNNGSTTEDDDVQLRIVPTGFGAGNALSFNGTNQYAELTHLRHDNQPDTELTIEFWINPTTIADGQAFIGKHDGLRENRVVVGYFNGGYEVNYFGTAVRTTSPIQKRTGWQHLALTIRRSGLFDFWQLYRNGVPILASTYPHQSSSLYNVLFAGPAWVLGQGWDGFTASNFFAGHIDEFRFWRRVRSQDDIRATMHHTFVGTEANLLAYYRFDTSTGTTIYDYGGAITNGDLQGATRQIPSTAPLGQTSAFLATSSALAHGPTGAQMEAQLTLVSPGDDDNVGLFTYGSPAARVVTNEAFPAGVDQRAQLIWGIHEQGAPFMNLTLPFGNLSGLRGTDPRVLRREHANAPWEDVTNQFILDRTQHTFRSINMPTHVSGSGSTVGHFAIADRIAFDLELSSTAPSQPTPLGNIVPLQLTLTNNSPYRAADIVTQINWPAHGLVFLYAEGQGSYNTTTHQWTLLSLEGWETRTINLNGRFLGTTHVYAEVQSATGTEQDAIFNNGSTTEDDDTQQVLLAQPVASGAALALSGNGQYVDLPGLDTFLSDGFRAMTLELWVNPHTTADQQNFIGKHTASGVNLILLGFYEGGYHVRMRDYTFTANAPKQTGWQHLVLEIISVPTQTILTLFRNGKLLHSGSTPTALGDLAGKPWTLGQDWDGQTTSDFLDGDIDEVRFWRGIRSLTIQQTDMHRTQTGSEPELAGYWRFDAGAGTTAYDYSGNGHHGVFHSATWSSQSTAPLGQTARDVRTANTPATVGQAGAQMQVNITSAAGDDNNLGIYTVGAHTDAPVSSGAFPTGITRRSPLIWGVHKRGTIAANLVFSFANLTNLTLDNPRLLKRTNRSQPWQDVTSRYTLDPVAKTFTRTNVSTFSEFTIADGSSDLPVELVAFEALRDAEHILLRWQTASETNNAGFHVEQQFVASDASPETAHADWHNLAFIEGSGTSTQARTYQHRLSDLEPGTYRFRLKQTDFDGTTSHSEQVEVHLEVPRILDLEPAYPNPFTVSTTLAFTVPADGYTSLHIYDVLGRNVATVFDGNATAGRRYHQWFDASMLAPGTYLYRLTFGSQHRTGRMVVLR